MSDSAVLGTYRAVVVNNNDPASGARVTLRVPQVLGDAESNWAVPAVPTSIIPAPGDLLWVSFEGGDVTSPVYTPPGLQQLTEAIDGLDGTQFTGSPPKPPSALTLSTAQNVSPEGVAAGVVVAEWVAPTENQDGSVPVKKLVGYRAQYSYDQITWSGGAFTSDTSWLFDGLRCGVTVYVRVQSLSNVSGPGTWEVDQIDTAPATGPSFDDLQTAIGNTDAKAQTALDSANGKNKVTFSADPPGTAAGKDGDTWFRIDGNDNVIGQWRCAGGDPVLWEPTQISHEVMASIDAAKITVGLLKGDQLDVGSISAQHLSSVIAIITKLCSSQSGRRWEADAEGIRVYDVDDAIIVNLSTNPDVPASVAGDLVASSLTVSDQLAVRGLVNEISKGAQLVLASGTTAPSSPPSLSIEWESISTPTDATFDPYKYGAARIGNYTYFLQDVYGQNSSIGRIGADTGNPDYGWSGLATGVRSGVGGVTAIGNVIYVLGFQTEANFTNTWWVEGWDSTTRARVSRWQYPQGASHRNPGIGTDGTNIVIAFTDTSTSYIQWRVFNKSTGAQVGSTVTTSYASARDCVGVNIGTFDYGSSRVVVHMKDAADVQVFNATGTRQANDEWPIATGVKPRGIYWDASKTRFVTYDPNAGRLHVYSTMMWTTQSSTWWVSGTWYDPDTGGTGTHETAQGPRKSIVMKKRARLRITPPPLPIRPVPNTADDATATRLFIGRGATDPGRTYMEYVVTTTATSEVISSFTFPASTAVTPPPASSNFPESSPAKITSAGGNFLVQGDGTGTWGAVNFGSAANSSTSVGGALTVSGQVTGQSVYASDGNGGVIVAGTTTTQGEPSLRLRRQTSDALHSTESYFYVQAGTGSAASWQTRKDGNIVNQLTLNEAYTQFSQQEVRVPSIKVGSATVHGTQATMRKSSATQSVPTGVWTKIVPGQSVAAWEDDGVVYSSGNWAATTSGFYVMQASLSWSSATGTHRAIRISDSANSAYVNAQSYVPTSAPWRTGTVVWCGYLAAGASLSVYFYHDAGANITVNADSATGDPATITFARVA